MRKEVAHDLAVALEVANPCSTVQRAAATRTTSARVAAAGAKTT